MQSPLCLLSFAPELKFIIPDNGIYFKFDLYFPYESFKISIMKNIIIIQINRLGDVINTLPLVNTLKETYADCRITLVCYRQFSRIVTQSPSGQNIDRFVLVDSNTLDKLVSFDKISNPADSPFPELYERYDIGVNLVFGDLPAVLFSKLKAERKYGQLKSDKGELRLGGDWPKYLFSCIPYRDYNLFNHTDLFTRYSGVSNREVPGFLVCPTEQLERADELLNENGSRGGLPIAFQMGASEAMRRWDVEKFARLGQLLKEKDNTIEIVLIGSKNESGLAEQFLSSAAYPVVNLVGKTDILELPAVLKRCRLLVSNDTGPIHIAAGVGTRTLGLYFLAAYFAETGPYGDGNIVVQAELPCLPCVDYYNCGHKKCRPLITPEAVFAAADALLNDRYDTTFDFPQVAVYRSRFMPNGSLIYLPVMKKPGKPLSPKFEKGLIYRIMWENEADVPAYLDMIRSELPGFGESAEVKRLIASFIAELENMGKIFSVGAASCEALVAEFGKPTGPDATAINDPLRNLNIIESFIDKREEPLSPLKHYFSFEIMDMEYLQFPELGEELKKKYLKLKGMTGSFLKKLNALRSAVCK